MYVVDDGEVLSIDRNGRVESVLSDKDIEGGAREVAGIEDGILVLSAVGEVFFADHLGNRRVITPSQWDGVQKLVPMNDGVLVIGSSGQCGIVATIGPPIVQELLFPFVCHLGIGHQGNVC